MQQVSLETLQRLERRLTVTIAAQDVDAEVDKRLKPLLKTAHIAGFRPGKVPLALLKKRFGAPLRQEVVDEFKQTTVTESLRQLKLRVVEEPVIELATGEDLAVGDVRYVATFEIYPEVQLAPMDTWVINRPEASFAEADIDTMLTNLRHQHQTWRPVERPAVLGDRVKVDFTGTLSDGQHFSGNTGNDVLMVLGDGVFVTGFERHLVGAVAGETREAEVTFPLGYHNAEVSGKSAIFTVVVKAVEYAQLPEWNEEFIRYIGVKEGTMAALRQAVQTTMERQFTHNVWEIVKDQVLDALYRHNPLDLPQKLVDLEIADLRNRIVDEQPPAVLAAIARRNVILMILLADIISQQNLSADPERVRNYIHSLAKDFETPEEMERAYMTDADQLQFIEKLVVEDMAIEWILNQVQIKPQPTSYGALLKTAFSQQAAKEITL